MLNLSKKFLQNFEEIVCSFFVSVMVILVILNVILRYFFSHSIFWAEEVATICFVWTVFVGASAVYKNRMDVGIDILVTKAPLDVQIFIRGLVRFLLLVINGYIFYMSVVFTKISMIKSTAVLGISSAVVNGALIVGFGLILIHTIRFMIKDVRQKYSS